MLDVRGGGGRCVSKSFKKHNYIAIVFRCTIRASIAQLGERKTEDLKVTGSIPVRGNNFVFL